MESSAATSPVLAVRWLVGESGSTEWRRIGSLGIGERFGLGTRARSAGRRPTRAGRWRRRSWGTVLQQSAASASALLGTGGESKSASRLKVIELRSV